MEGLGLHSFLVSKCPLSLEDTLLSHLRMQLLLHLLGLIGLGGERLSPENSCEHTDWGKMQYLCFLGRHSSTVPMQLCQQRSMSTLTVGGSSVANTMEVFK